MSIRIPRRLKQGDTVAVVATARAIDPQAIRSGIDILKNWGLHVNVGKYLYTTSNLFAGTDQQRLEDLQHALDSPDIKAIFCARGGYGTTRIIDRVDWRGFKRTPKWICGFSDVTALLCHAHSLGFASMHSSMPQLFNGERASEDHRSLKQVLFEGNGELTAGPNPQNRPGIAQGILVGGNLSLLVHLIGTGSDISTEGKILMIEEVDEYLYHMDRMMVQLVRSGKLKHIKGMVIGHLTKMKEGDLKFGTDASGIIRSHLSHTKIPVGFGFSFGHESPNLAIPLGVEARLQINQRGSKLTLEY